MPEQGQHSRSTCRSASGAATERARFDEWRRALPRPLASPAKFALEGRQDRDRHPASGQRRRRRALFLPGRRRADRLCRAAKLPPQGRHADRRAEAPPRRARAAVGRAGAGRRARAGDQRRARARCRRAAAAIGGPGRECASSTRSSARWLGGLLLNLMPCVFPILALKALHLAGRAATSGRRDAMRWPMRPARWSGRARWARCCWRSGRAEARRAGRSSCRTRARPSSCCCWRRRSR